MPYTLYKGKSVETIDATPTWESVMPIYIKALKNPNSTQEGLVAAEQELYHLTRCMDLVNAKKKKV